MEEEAVSIFLTDRHQIEKNRCMSDFAEDINNEINTCQQFPAITVEYMNHNGTTLYLPYALTVLMSDWQPIKLRKTYSKSVITLFQIDAADHILHDHICHECESSTKYL